MSQPDQRSKVTVEDLLRLKRAERPNPEFWVNFERELRQKQLTALVQKRRWWHELPVRLNRRVYMPAGAVAIVAFTLVTVRYSAPTRIAQIPNMAPQIAAMDPAIEVLAATEVSEPVPSPSGRLEEPVAIAAVPAPALQVAGDAVASAPAGSAFQETEAPSAGLLVANLTRLDQSESDLVNPVMGSRLSTPARVQTAAVAQPEEVAAMTTAAPSKYRLIARYAERAPSPAPAAPAVVRERLARRLGDDLGDSISRIGVVGDRVSLKF